MALTSHGEEVILFNYIHEPSLWYKHTQVNKHTHAHMQEHTLQPNKTVINWHTHWWASMFVEHSAALRRK